MRVKAVIFDMDGLMLDTERLAREIWVSEATRTGAPIDSELYHSLIGRSYADIEDILTKAFHSHADARAYIDRCLELYFERIKHPIPPRPGLFEFLDYCDERGLRKAVGTSTGRSMALVKLKSGGIEGRFETMVTASDVAKGKPAPDIFLKCAEDLGLQPSECLVLEDSPSGVKAAHAAGERVIMIPDMLEPDAQIRALANAVLVSLSDVQGFLEREGWVETTVLPAAR